MNFRGRFSSPLNRLNSGTRARKSRRLGARALSAMLAAGALVAAPLVGAAPALAADPDPNVVAIDGDMKWDVVSSWHGYISALGSVEANWAPQGTINLDSGTLDLSLGSIEWTVEAHGIHLAFEDVALTGNLGGTATITTTMRSSEGIVNGDQVEDVTLATIDLPDALTDSGELHIDGAVATIDAGVTDVASQWAYAGEDTAPLTLNLTADLPDDNGGDDGEEGEDGEDGDDGDDGDEGEDDNDGEDPDEDETVWTPELELLDEAGNALGNTEVTSGDIITVRGTGFDPEANVGGRGMPIPAHLPQGYYVVFGKFAPYWKPSDDAPSSDRAGGDQGWVLADTVLDQVPENFQAAVRKDWVPHSDDGTFEAELTADEIATGPENGVYGVYDYPAGGITNADFEIGEPGDLVPSDSGAETAGGEDV